MPAQKWKNTGSAPAFWGRLLPLVPLLALLLAIFAPDPAAAAYPARRVNLVLGWGAGGITDVAARVFAPIFSEHLGVPVIVQNKPGAAGAIGTDYVQRMKADGANLLFSAETPATFRVLGVSKLSFEDFTPISMVSGSEKVLVVAADSPYRSFGDLIRAIRENPGKIRFSYTGPGASGHIQGLLMQEAGKLEFSMTPFGSGKESLLAVLSGQVDFTSPNIGTIRDYLAAGALRVLANFDARPSRYAPEAPPVTDELPGLAPYLPLDYPNCLLVKKGTAPETVRALEEAAAKTLADPRWRKFLAEQWYVGYEEIRGEAVNAYWARWASIVCWILYDHGVAKVSPEEFGIPRPGAGK